MRDLEEELRVFCSNLDARMAEAKHKLKEHPSSAANRVSYAWAGRAQILSGVDQDVLSQPLQAGFGERIGGRVRLSH
eukprot:2588256-Rhodomonas_salina.2